MEFKSLDELNKALRGDIIKYINSNGFDKVYVGTPFMYMNEWELARAIFLLKDSINCDKTNVRNSNK